MKSGVSKWIDKMYINDTLHIINTLKTLGVEQFTKLTVFEKSDDEMLDNEH